MARVSKKQFDRPDETRPFADKGRLELVELQGTALGRGTFEPGWRWSECVKPLAGTESCETHHTGFVLSGRMHVRMDDGEDIDLKAGDAFDIPSGHDGWVVGSEPCVMLDFVGAAEYAQRQRGRAAQASEPSHLPH